MPKLKLTSPGALLIFATCLAGTILLLDAFFLRPYVDAQRDAALREVAARTVQTVRDDLQAEQNLLMNLCRTHARDVRLEACLKGDSGFDAFAQTTLAGTVSELAWVSDENGKVLSTWSSLTAADEKAAPSAPPELAAALASLGAHPAGRTGLLQVGNRVVVFAQAEAGSGASAGLLGLARYLDGAMLTKIGVSIGGDLVLAAGDALPPNLLAKASASEAFWPISDERLGVAWLASDPTGQHLGYFRSDVPVGYVSSQASVARRIVLIILSLSVGLVSLIIMGTHILIAGPVVRLLRRLQQIDSGEGTVAALTRDLHGEPLVLARRLESAFERLAHMSKTDQLTGLANRTHFQEVLDAFYHQARRYNRPLSVIALDVDFFKAVNDTAGHQAGDEVLKWVGAAIERACRKADLPARMGGDEFAVLLPETPSLDAEYVAQRIAQNISSEPAVVAGLRLNLTASIGVADLNCGDFDGPQKMVVQADRALYAAKEAGRNRIVLAHELEAQLSNGPETRKVEVLYKKLAGLDNRFKDLFLHALEEVVSVMEQRDPHMADHARKVQHYAELIANEMGLPHRVVQRIRVSAMLHDIGMLAMPDSVLLHPGPLNEDQTRNIRRHPLLSVRIMERMQFLEQEIPAVRYHHERYDGRGYPEGLAGASIPLTARILSVADAFSAMTSPRSFRDARPLPKALDEIRHGSGSQFDPVVVDALATVATRLGDHMLDLPAEQKTSLWRDEDSTPGESASGQPAQPESAVAGAIAGADDERE